LVSDAGAGAFTFRHELLRVAVYEHAFSMDRIETHRTVAQLLADRPNTPAALLAYHWSLAGDVARAAHYAAEAGDQAMRLNAYSSARDSYLTAIQSSAFVGAEAAALEEKAAIAYDALGAAIDAAKHFQNAAELCREQGDPQNAARLELRFAANAYRAGRVGEAEQACARVLNDSNDAVVLYGAHATLAQFYSTRNEPARVQLHIDSAEALRVDGQVRDMLSLAWARAYIADEGDDALRAARGAVELAGARSTPALHAINLVNFAMLARKHGRDGPESMSALTQAIDIANANGATYTAGYAYCERARALHFRGELSAAYQSVLDAVALHVEAIVVRIFLAAVGLDVLAELGIVERFPAFRDPDLLDAAFAGGEPVRFAALAAAHVHASAITGEAAHAARTTKRALSIIQSFDGVSRSLAAFALHGDDEDRALIFRLLPETTSLPPVTLDRIMIEAIISVKRGDESAADRAREARNAARLAGAPLYEALANELLDRSADAAAIYERIGAISRRVSRRTKRGTPVA
jgi:tetratricopeptide (TPR) repeat protein